MLLGQQDKPVDPRRPLPDLMAEQRFAEPIVTADAIAASLPSLAQSLGGVLEQRGLGLRSSGSLFLPRRWPGAAHRFARWARRCATPNGCCGCCNEKLDALADPLDPGFGFDLIRLEAMLAEEDRGSRPSASTAMKMRRWQIHFLVDRLSARFGEARVLRFVPQDTHIPEAASAAVPAQDRDFGQETWPQAPRKTIRRSGRCACLKSRKKSAPALPPCRMARPRSFAGGMPAFDVARAEGPERIAMEWWRSDGEKRRPAIISGSKPARASVSGSIATGFIARTAWHRAGICKAFLRDGRCFAADFRSRRRKMPGRNSSYAELAVTTNYSFLRGASHPGQFVEQAARSGLCRHRHRRPQQPGRRGAGLDAWQQLEKS